MKTWTIEEKNKAMEAVAADRRAGMSLMLALKKHGVNQSSFYNWSIVTKKKKRKAATKRASVVTTPISTITTASTSTAAVAALAAQKVVVVVLPIDGLKTVLNEFVLGM